MTLPDKTVRFLQKAGMDEENLRQLETLRKEDGNGTYSAEIPF